MADDTMAAMERIAAAVEKEYDKAQGKSRSRAGGADQAMKRMESFEKRFTDALQSLLKAQRKDRAKIAALTEQVTILARDMAALRVPVAEVVEEPPLLDMDDDEAEETGDDG